jgi:hypothetical protein
MEYIAMAIGKIHKNAERIKGEIKRRACSCVWG